MSDRLTSEEAAILHAQLDAAGVEAEDVVYHACDEDEEGGYMVEHVSLTLSQRVAVVLGEVERLRARVAGLERAAAFACESPPPRCDCSGCAQARTTFPLRM